MHFYTLDEMIESRKKELIIRLNKLKKAQNQLGDIPNGYIRVSKSNNCLQYYYKSGKQNENWKYLQVKNQDLARKIVQSDYNHQLYKTIQDEIAVLEKYQKQGGEKEQHALYENLCAGRKRLVKPLIASDEAVISKWEAEEFEKNTYNEDGKCFVTSKGEIVRSKSEVIIADSLAARPVPYKYEKPLILGDFKCLPDFTVLNVRLRRVFYHEHFGMMDDPVYAERAIKKIQNYERHGIFLGVQLIVTFESSNVPLDTRQLSRIIEEHYL